MGIYIVTHGKKFIGPNPWLSKIGFNEVYRLRPLLPENPSEVICGTGKRHINTAKVLGLRPTRYTSVVGGPESMELVDGRKIVILADVTYVPFEQYTTTADTVIALNALILSLPNNSVICAGRPCVIAAGYKDAKSAALYRVEVLEDKISAITEITALGKSETGTV